MDIWNILIAWYDAEHEWDWALYNYVNRNDAIKAFKALLEKKSLIKNGKIVGMDCYNGVECEYDGRDANEFTKEYFSHCGDWLLWIDSGEYIRVCRSNLQTSYDPEEI